MRILLLADSNWRDSVGLSFLKLALQKRHPQTFVASFDVCLDAVQLINPHVVVLNHVMGARNKRIAEFVKRQGGLSVILPTEGRPNTNKVLKWYVEQNNLPRYADLFLSWSDRVTLDAVETRVVGCPRFDIYQQKWRGLADSQERFFARHSLPRRPTIGFSSSFPGAKFSYRNRKFNERDSRDLGVSKIYDTEQLALDEYANMQDFLLWIRAVVNEYGDDYNVVVKPHPMEDAVLWRKFAADAGVTLIEGDYIFNFQVDLLVARAGCLTHQDAWLMGVQTIHCLMGGEGISGATAESLERGRSARHVIDLLDAVYDWTQGGEAVPAFANDFLDRWGFTVPNAAEKTASAMVDFVEKRQPSMPDIPIENYGRFNALLKQHAAQNARPTLDGMGHYGKAVTRDIIEYWCRRIDNAKQKCG